MHHAGAFAGWGIAQEAIGMDLGMDLALQVAGTLMEGWQDLSPACTTFAWSPAVEYCAFLRG